MSQSVGGLGRNFSSAFEHILGFGLKENTFFPF
jgi:hypothetical protein